jgi:hypothetical protein
LLLNLAPLQLCTLCKCQRCTEYMIFIGATVPKRE